MAEQIPPGFDDTDFEPDDFQTEPEDAPEDEAMAATALLVLRRRRR